MNYGVLKDKTLKLLEQKVSALIAEGWEPQGGVALGVVNESLIIYAQAMIMRT